MTGDGRDERRGPRLHRASLRCRRSQCRPRDRRPAPTGHGVVSPAQQAADPAGAARRPRRRSGAGRGRRRGRPPSAAASRSRRARSASGMGSPAQPQRTVRSFGSTPRLTPWSQPRTAPPSRSRWLPLRSELLSAASSTATVRSAGSPQCATTTSSPRVDSPSRTTNQPSGTSSGADDVDQRVLRVVGERTDPPLHRPGPERALAQDRRRDDAESPRLADEVGRALAGRRACRRGSPRAGARRPPACG